VSRRKDIGEPSAESRDGTKQGIEETESRGVGEEAKGKQGEGEGIFSLTVGLLAEYKGLS
jgi:hypothetical protein